MPEGPQIQTAPPADGTRGRETKEPAANTRVWGYVIYVACCGLAAVGIVATAWAVGDTLAHDSARVAWSGVGIMAAIIVGVWAAGRAALYFLSAR
jgi:hypothetical protein